MVTGIDDDGVTLRAPDGATERIADTDRHLGGGVTASPLADCSAASRAARSTAPAG